MPLGGKEKVSGPPRSAVAALPTVRLVRHGIFAGSFHDLQSDILHLRRSAMSVAASLGRL